MKKTLLLVFIHGFKGGEDTFGPDYQFTRDLRSLVAAALPKLEVRTLVYPRFETRGDLAACVARFRTWLQDKVIDLEVAAATPSPTVDPSVRVVLVGHSMGGVVAAETLIALTSDEPVPHGPPPAAADDDKNDRPLREASPVVLSSLMFPYVQGVLAFDTPFLGIAPGVVAHGAEGHYATATAAMTQLGALWGGGGAAAAAAASAPRSGSGTKSAPPALTAPPPKTDAAGKKDAVAAGSGGGGGGWGNWGRIAAYAGAGAVLAAGGAAAYANRAQLTEGFRWATSHLEFVGCLARKEELLQRVRYCVRAREELGVGFGNLYTRLGRAASTRQVSMVGAVLPGQRTFCNLPNRVPAGDWREAVNDAATDETGAHMGW